MIHGVRLRRISFHTRRFDVWCPINRAAPIVRANPLSICVKRMARSDIVSGESVAFRSV
jgi:hypothetical protein